ncbi:hypothetical protein [Rhizobium rhizogenes]|uniref:hypothetical protein n=1 Tax=Rhizobium rhizogenes TaxID=359 RepID=UPI001573DD6C|nr:hypothetical protein [Rhizobium rhizogenes]NTF98067.1 hypothetical protein [Rhizobium rhizogenes]
MSDTVVIALGGYSESGKSSSGRYMERLGFKRIKIAEIYQRIFSRIETELSFKDWSYWIDRTDPEWIADNFIRELEAEIGEQAANKCTIESLYGDILASQLRRHMGDRFKVVFIDIDRDVRLIRQMHREGLQSIDEAAILLDPRDEMKRSWGADRVKEIADFVVDNSGSLQKLEQQLDAIATAVS